MGSGQVTQGLVGHSKELRCNSKTNRGGLESGLYLACLPVTSAHFVPNTVLRPLLLAPFGGLTTIVSKENRATER